MCDQLPVIGPTNCRLYLRAVYAAESKYASPSSFRRPDERDWPVPPCGGDGVCIHADSSNSRSFAGEERTSLISTGGSKHKLRNEAMKPRKKPLKKGFFHFLELARMPVPLSGKACHAIARKATAGREFPDPRGRLRKEPQSLEAFVFHHKQRP